MVSLDELRSFAHRANPEEYLRPYGRIFFRPVSIYLTWICVNLNISANQVTVAQLLVGLVAAAAVVCPEVWIAMLGLFLFQFAYMLDHVDGEIARFRKQASLTGKFLDEIGHETVVPLMYLGFAVGDFLRHGRWEVIPFGALAGLFSLRFDLLAKADVIVNFARSDLGSRFDYYKEFPSRVPVESEDNKRRPIMTLYQLFAYPAILNTLSILWLLDHFAGTGSIVFGKVGLLYFVIVANGILIPIRRALTIRSIAIASRVETDYLELKEKIGIQKHLEKANVPNS